MKKIFFVVILIFVALAFAGCGSRGAGEGYPGADEPGTSYSGANPPGQTHEPPNIQTPTPPGGSGQPPMQTPAPDTPPMRTPAPGPPPIAETVTWTYFPRCLVPVRGVITSWYGPVGDDGAVPWYVEWVEIGITKEDGTTATIVGIHSTGFFFGVRPEVGMEVVAYVEYDAPVFTHDMEMYIATAIVAGFPDGVGVAICCDYADGAEPFMFMVTNNAEVGSVDFGGLWIHEDNPSLWRNTGARSLAEFLTRRESSQYFTPRCAVILYYFTVDGVPVADSFITVDGLSVANSFTRLNREMPLSDRDTAMWREAGRPPINLNFTDYILSAGAFDVVGLPFTVNGEHTNSPAIFAADGVTVLVPFRETYVGPDGLGNGIGFGNFVHLTYEGELIVGGGGGGSENSHWHVGLPHIFTMGGGMPVCTPPVIVDGVVYIPLMSGIDRGAPGASAWVLDDEIIAFGEQYPYGPWFGRVWWEDFYLDEDELAGFPIIVNGVEIESPPAVHVPGDGWFGSIVVPLEPVAKALGYRILSEADGIYMIECPHGDAFFFGSEIYVDDMTYIALRVLSPLDAKGIIHNGRIIIESRGS